ncbi:MAG: rane protein [Glaciihabitans sp.]|nr:rane protein [Glaciihabitans sp.]MCW2653931.1 rane protein [Mycobacterium sp.]MDT5131454.1 putative oxidoreductase [Mycobacterium sp.]MDT5233686.1 putative oxidoreductase [Mycobacterium sp.]
MPSATYGGDFETTTIPHYNSGTPAPGGRGLGLLSGPEPLPYVQPGSAEHGAHAPADLIGDEFVDDRVRAAGRRGTQHLGLLLLRVGVGTILVAHGLQKAFGWWGGQGLAGFRNSLSDMGYQHADVLTYLAAGTQIAAGLLLVLGLFTPVAAAAALAYLLNGVLANLAAQHQAGYFAFFVPDGNQFQVLMITALAAIILVGPGRYGFDAGRGWARRPFIGSFAALLLGIGGGIAIWVLLNGHNPLG